MQRTETNTAKGGNTTWDMGIDTTLIRILARNAELLGNRVAMREKRLGIWQETTWSHMLDTTLACAAGMESLGFGTEDALLVLGDNRPRLYMGMLAAGMLGGHAMPVYPDATPDEIRHFMQEAHVGFVLAEDQEQVDKVLDLGDQGATIKNIIYDEPRGLANYPNPGLVSW
jgi:long-chain acyl-CoA synthetase